MKGVCQFCGCTADQACEIETLDEAGRVIGSTPCRWADREQTICTACLDQVNAETLAELVLAEMEGAEPVVIELPPAEAWAVAMFLQEAIAAHGNHDAATNPTLFAAAKFLLWLHERLGRDRPAMDEALDRSGQSCFAEYENVTIDGAHAALGGEELTPGGIIIPH